MVTKTNLEKSKWLEMQVDYCKKNDSYGSHYENYLNEIRLLVKQIKLTGCGCNETDGCDGKVLCDECQESLNICEGLL